MTPMTTPPDLDSGAAAPPAISLPRLFARFLRFGVLAWGGPVAQIGMLKQELVDDERWVEPARFNRVLAVYQALPGPEAHELCVYFGMIARGRPGGLLAGLGFMLPGVLFVLGAAWLYVEHGIDGELAAAFVGAQVAAIALILRAVHRIGSTALVRPVHWIVAIVVAALLLAPIGDGEDGAPVSSGAPAHVGEATALELAQVGIVAGSLSFGGAYTSIGFVHAPVVERNEWASDEQFLDALAISGALPSPMIVFATFVGYVAGGLGGALAMTAMIFLPAFAVTLIGHHTLELVVDSRRIHTLLDLVTAAVVGLIAATAVTLLAAAIDSVAAAVLLVACLALLVTWRSRGAILTVVVGSATVAMLADLVGVG